MALTPIANKRVTTGDTIIIKTHDKQRIGINAPAWMVTDHEVIEVGDTVTSIKWKLNPVGEHAYVGARPGQHEYAANVAGQVALVS